MKQVTRDLLDARTLLQLHGWCRGWYHGRKGTENESALCITGAMMTVVGVDRLDMPDYRNPRVQAMRRAFIAAYELDSDWAIARWNDEVCRDAEHASKALQYVAAWAESFAEENVVA